jgi:tetratricopeptide (TPR) repeat protein
MKKTVTLIALIVFIFSTVIINAERAELHELFYSAKNKDKLILLKVYDSEASDTFSDSTVFSDRFIEASLYASNPSDLAIINEYNVEAYPSIIVLNSHGHLILPVKQVDNLAEIEEYLGKALKMKHELKPLAQFDLEYRNNKMNKTSLYEYIAKRTLSGLDNSEMIDRYTHLATTNDLLDKKILLLFIDENNFNIPGSFCSFIEQNQETIRQILKLGDERFYRLTEKSVEYNFQKICQNQDEARLSYIIDVKANVFNSGDREILYNEYMTRYFHSTYQPLKLIDYAREYVNSVVKYKEQQEQSVTEANKRLFSPSIKNSAVRTMCASKLRDAAQYVVEIMSAKSVLTDALSWSIKAEQFAGDDRYDIYETRAYILYKLGRRDEALTNMEKAYNTIHQDNIEQKKNVGFNLIKMKRGEKIY